MGNDAPAWTTADRGKYIKAFQGHSHYGHSHQGPQNIPTVTRKKQLVYPGQGMVSCLLYEPHPDAWSLSSVDNTTPASPFFLYWIFEYQLVMPHGSSGEGMHGPYISPLIQCCVIPVPINNTKYSYFGVHDEISEKHLKETKEAIFRLMC